MGNYGIYIWPAYGVVLLGMLGFLLKSLFYSYKIKRVLRLALFKDENHSTR